MPWGDGTLAAMTWWMVLDIALTFGLYLRLTRLVVRDDLGQWYIVNPVQRWADPVAALVEDGRALASRRDDLIAQGVDPQALTTPISPMYDPEPGTGWRSKIAAGIDCPWCVGFWIGCATLASLYLAGGPGDAVDAWRWVAGAFSMNYLGAHLGTRLGDTAD